MKYVRYDWVCGKHSGIPACCRVWFIAAWTFALPYSWKRAYDRLIARRSGAWEYVPCPVCLVTGRGRGVPLIDCTCAAPVNGQPVSRPPICDSSPVSRRG